MSEKALNKEELVDAICGLSLLEASDVADALKERLNIPDMPMGGMIAAPAAGGDAGADEAAAKDEFTLILESFGEKKTGVIKAIREIKKAEGEEIGLKEAKEIAETSNAKICENINKEKSDKYLKLLVDAGAKAKLD